MACRCRTTALDGIPVLDCPPLPLRYSPIEYEFQQYKTGAASPLPKLPGSARRNSPIGHARLPFRPRRTQGSRSSPALAWIGSLSVLSSAILMGLPETSRMELSGLSASSLLALAAAELAFMSTPYIVGGKSRAPPRPGRNSRAIPSSFAYVFQALPRIGLAATPALSATVGRPSHLCPLSPFPGSSRLHSWPSSWPAVQGRPRRLRHHHRRGRGEGQGPPSPQKNRSKRQKPGFLHGLLEWVDAIAFAAIAVILINIFVFQLYVIPFRVHGAGFPHRTTAPFTVKVTMGPRLPLTEWRLPFLATLKVERGHNRDHRQSALSRES